MIFHKKTLASLAEDRTTIGVCWRYNPGRDTHILRVTLNNVLFFIHYKASLV